MQIVDGVKASATLVLVLDQATYHHRRHVNATRDGTTGRNHVPMILARQFTHHVEHVSELPVVDGAQQEISAIPVMLLVPGR